VNGDRFVEILARDFHGALAAGHAFAVIYNLRRGNRIDAAAHATFLVYDLLSTMKHHKESKR
jgi:hypothetical protein